MDCVSKKNDEVIISIVKAKKEQGSHDIEFFLRDPEAGEWMNQVIDFEQLKREVIEKGKEYVNSILLANKENNSFDKLRRAFDAIS